MKPKLYRVEIMADVNATHYADETTVIAHLFVTRCANQMRRITVNADFVKKLASACQVRKSYAEDLIEMFLKAGILRELGSLYPYIVEDFHDEDFATIDDLEGVTFG